MDVERQECRRARYEEGQTAHDTAQRGADHRLHLRRIARDARDQRARAERIDLLHRQMHDALEAVLADVVAEILRTEIDADAAHDAGGDGVDERDQRSYEGKEDAADSGREDGARGGVSGDGDAGNGLTIGGVRAAAEESTGKGADTVAEKRVMKTGIFEKVFFNDIRKVFVVRDMLSKLYDSDGDEENRQVSDRRAVEFGGFALLYRFKEGEFGIIEETLES